MILMYHKTDIIKPSKWWVTVKRFEYQILSLYQQKKFVYLDEFDSKNEKHVVITFDDAYENIFNHAFPILKKHKIPFEVFINGELLGDWNHFDRSELHTRFCSLDHLIEMSKHGGRIQWHTSNHANLTKLTDGEVIKQIEVPSQFKDIFIEPHFKWFAYPYGAHNEKIVDMVRKKFYGALSVDDGNDFDPHQLNRVTVDEQWDPKMLEICNA